MNRRNRVPATDWVGFVVCLVPIFVACARAFKSDWRPVYDSAYFSTRALDVLTQHHPFVGSWSTFGAVLDESVNNIGPLQLLLLAPFTRLHPLVGAAVGVAVVNVLAVVAVWWASRSLFGSRGVIAVMAATALLQMSFGAPALIDARQQHALLLPFWALVWLTVVLVQGCDWAVLPWVVAGSLVAQTHFSYAYLVVTLVATGTVGYVVAGRARWGTASFLGRVAAGVLLALALWSHTLWGQAFGTGNLGRVLGHAGGKTPAGWSTGARIVADSSFGYPLWWPGGVSDFHEPWAFGPLVSWGIVVAWVLVLAAVVIAAARRSDRRTVILGALAAALIVAALVSAARIPPSDLDSLPQTYFWLWPVSLFAAVVAVAGLAPRLPIIDHVVGVGAVLTTVAAALALPDRYVFPPWEISDELEGAAGRPMLEQMDQSLDALTFDLGSAVVLDDATFRLLIPDYYNIVGEMILNGVDVHFADGSPDLERFGAERCETGDEKWRLEVVVGAGRPELTSWDVVLAKFDGPDESEVAEFNGLNDEMLDLLQAGEIELDREALPSAGVPGEQILAILDAPEDTHGDLWFHLFVLVEDGTATVPRHHLAAYERWSDLARAKIASHLLVYLTPNYFPTTGCRP